MLSKILLSYLLEGKVDVLIQDVNVVIITHHKGLSDLTVHVATLYVALFKDKIKRLS